MEREEGERGGRERREREEGERGGREGRGREEGETLREKDPE